MSWELPLPEIKFDERGLVPVVVQDAESGEVLMLAYANQEALTRTVETGETHYFSRSRQELWRKGATSGHSQQVVEVRFDCDEDALLYRVRQTGPACHTGEHSCFFRSLAPGETAPSTGEVMALLERVVDDRYRSLPDGSYVTKLHQRGLGYIAQKVIEEAGERVVAALERQDDALVDEVADLLFHLMVLLKERDVRFQEVAETLAARHRTRSSASGSL
jgi:phosphoribosyl-ATP pyrophosphohydrolase/phosphoribosyl-AMP cyclohydrolase